MTLHTSEIDRQAARLIEIGIALSAETDLNRLLEKIVTHARELTGADAGTLYTLSGDVLKFKIIQNDSLGIRLGGAMGDPITLDPVKLNKDSVSGYVAITGDIVNIEDVYHSDKFDFSGPKRYDEKTGYRSRSMLVVPMRDHEGEIIGVLQLLNALDKKTREIVVFNPKLQDLAVALASQAAVALTNAKLINEVKELFDSLIKVLAVAVDAKSPYTGNHVQRVAILNSMIAGAINETSEGAYKNVSFTKYQLEEMRLAGWLHDVGKVTTPSVVMDKATKLSGEFDRVELVKERFKILGLVEQNKVLCDYVKELGGDPATALARVEGTLAQQADDLAFLVKANTPEEFMSDDKLARLGELAKKTYEFCGVTHPLLTDDEKLNLSIRKGSLNDGEIQVMRDHVLATSTILKEVPFDKTRHMKNVPKYAGEHHEKINGKGYPSNKCGDELALQSRILAVADFYEALSAKDRPYKKPMPPEMVLNIMRKAAAEGEIDPQLLEFVIEHKIHERFEEEYDRQKAKKLG